MYREISKYNVKIRHAKRGRGHRPSIVIIDCMQSILQEVDVAKQFSLQQTLIIREGRTLRIRYKGIALSQIIRDSNFVKKDSKCSVRWKCAEVQPLQSPAHADSYGELL